MALTLESVQAALSVLGSRAPSGDSLRAASRLLLGVQQRPDALGLAQALVSAAATMHSPALTLMYALSTLDNCLRGAACSPAEGRVAALSVTASLVSAPPAALTHAVKSKIAALLCTIIEVQFPQAWPDFAEDLAALTAVSMRASEVVAMALVNVAEDCVSRDFLGGESEDADASGVHFASVAGAAVLSASRRHDIISGLIACAPAVLAPTAAILAATVAGIAVFRSSSRVEYSVSSVERLQSACAAVHGAAGADILDAVRRACEGSRSAELGACATDELFNLCTALVRAVGSLLVLYPATATRDVAFCELMTQLWGCTWALLLGDEAGCIPASGKLAFLSLLSAIMDSLLPLCHRSYDTFSFVARSGIVRCKGVSLTAASSHADIQLALSTLVATAAGQMVSYCAAAPPAVQLAFAQLRRSAVLATGAVLENLVPRLASLSVCEWQRTGAATAALSRTVSDAESNTAASGRIAAICGCICNCITNTAVPLFGQYAADIVGYCTASSSLASGLCAALPLVSLVGSGVGEAAETWTMGSAQVSLLDLLDMPVQVIILGGSTSLCEWLRAALLPVLLNAVAEPVAVARARARMRQLSRQPPSCGTAAFGNDTHSWTLATSVASGMCSNTATGGEGGRVCVVPPAHATSAGVVSEGGVSEGVVFDGVAFAGCNAESYDTLHVDDYECDAEQGLPLFDAAKLQCLRVIEVILAGAVATTSAAASSLVDIMTAHTVALATATTPRELSEGAPHGAQFIPCIQSIDALRLILSGPVLRAVAAASAAQGGTAPSQALWMNAKSCLAWLMLRHPASNLGEEATIAFMAAMCARVVVLVADAAPGVLQAEAAGVTQQAAEPILPQVLQYVFACADCATASSSIGSTPQALVESMRTLGRASFRALTRLCECVPESLVPLLSPLADRIGSVLGVCAAPAKSRRSVLPGGSVSRADTLPLFTGLACVAARLPDEASCRSFFGLLLDPVRSVLSRFLSSAGSTHATLLEVTLFAGPCSCHCRCGIDEKAPSTIFMEPCGCILASTEACHEILHSLRVFITVVQSFSRACTNSASDGSRLAILADINESVFPLASLCLQTLLRTQQRLAFAPSGSTGACCARASATMDVLARSFGVMCHPEECLSERFSSRRDDAYLVSSRADGPSLLLWDQFTDSTAPAACTAMKTDDFSLLLLSRWVSSWISASIRASCEFICMILPVPITGVSEAALLVQARQYSAISQIAIASMAEYSESVPIRLAAQVGRHLLVPVVHCGLALLRADCTTNSSALAAFLPSLHAAIKAAHHWATLCEACLADLARVGASSCDGIKPSSDVATTSEPVSFLAWGHGSRGNAICSLYRSCVGMATPCAVFPTAPESATSPLLGSDVAIEHCWHSVGQMVSCCTVISRALLMDESSAALLGGTLSADALTDAGDTFAVAVPLMRIVARIHSLHARQSVDAASACTSFLAEAASFCSVAMQLAPRAAHTRRTTAGPLPECSPDLQVWMHVHAHAVGPALASVCTLWCHLWLVDEASARVVHKHRHAFSNGASRGIEGVRPGEDADAWHAKASEFSEGLLARLSSAADSFFSLALQLLVASDISTVESSSAAAHLRASVTHAAGLVYSLFTSPQSGVRPSSLTDTLQAALQAAAPAAHMLPDVRSRGAREGSSSSSSSSSSSVCALLSEDPSASAALVLLHAQLQAAAAPAASTGAPPAGRLALPPEQLRKVQVRAFAAVVADLRRCLRPPEGGVASAAWAAPPAAAASGPSRRITALYERVVASSRSVFAAPDADAGGGSEAALGLALLFGDDAL